MATEHDALRDTDIARWRRAYAAFDRLLELPPEQREQATGSLELDDDARALLRRLIDADRASNTMPDQRIPTATEASLAGRRIGSWVLEQRIGQGGMAVVYRARAIDDAQRKVAIKLLTLGALAGPGAERFRRERMILGRLDHPSIAPLIDAGVEPDGTPWLAMSLVQGQHIDHWCQARGVDIRGRVRLILEVCDAVGFAHRLLVVHRDLKPSNVLVDETGRVRLLDFGIARLIHDAIEDPTSTCWRALTPRFAAPEQFAGAPASTAMDVFGLGALLYAVLTGTPPRVGSGPDDPIVPPSRCLQQRVRAGPTTAGVDAADVRGDLDAIVLMALADDPMARYLAVGDLAADLRRWLAGDTVHARARTRLESAAHFMRRHRIAIGVVAVCAFSIVAGGIAALWQANRAIAAQHEAEAASARATALNAFLVELFGNEAPGLPTKSLPTTRDLLERGEAAAMAESDMDPSVRADMLDALTEVRLLRGEPSVAVRLIATTLAIAERLPVDGHAVRARALMRRSVTERLSDQLDAGLASLDAALAQMADQPRSELTLEILREQTAAYWEAEQHAKAEANVDLLLREAAANPDLPRKLQVAIHSIAGAVYRDLGRLRESLREAETVVALRRAQYGSQHFRVATALSNAANVACDIGRVDVALRWNSQALAIYDAVLGDRPSEHRGNAHAGRGVIESTRGNTDVALQAFERGTREFSKARGRDPDAEQWAASWWRGVALANAGRWSEALGPLQHAVRLLGDANPPLPQHRLVGLAWSARSHCALGAFAEAETALAEARREASNLTRALPQELSLVDEAAAACALESGDPRTALQHIETAIARDDGHEPGYVDQRSRRRLLAARTLRALGRMDEAESRAREAISILVDAGLADHPYLRSIESAAR